MAATPRCPTALPPPAWHSDLQMSRLCAVSPGRARRSTTGLDKKSTPNKNAVLTQGSGRWGVGAELGIGVGGGGVAGVGVSEIGVRTNRLNFAESKGKYTTRIVTEVTRVTSYPPFTYPQLPLSSAQLPLSPVPSSAHPPAPSPTVTIAATNANVLSG